MPFIPRFADTATWWPLKYIPIPVPPIIPALTIAGQSSGVRDLSP